jgi:hypothetical protein
MEAKPLACTLEGSALADRIEAWRAVVARASTRRVEDGRFVAVYPKDVQILDRLRELIAAEAECCAFLRVDVDERPDAIVTELRLPDELPDSMRLRVVALFGG